VESECLICISSKARDVEHFFMYSVAICTSSFEIVCSVHLPISSLVWFFWSLVFWAPCKFWLFIPC
jgi:hypothetical protein